MKLLKIMRPIAFSVLLLACAGIAAAQNTSTSELAMSALVQTAVRLDITTNGGVTVNTTGAGLFNVNLGTVNGFGVGTPATGVTAAPDATGALYTTPISVTPVYTGFTTETATLEVEQDGSGDPAMAREGADAASAVAPSVIGPVEFTSGVASGTATTRVVGFYVARTTVAGAVTANLVYTVTVD